MSNEVKTFIAELFSGLTVYDDHGAGAHNALVLKQAGLRPAFFDTSCLLYRLLYSKANDYCKCARDNDALLVHLICCDFIRDVSEACSQFGCAPVLCFDSKVSYRREQVYDKYKIRTASKRTESEERVFRNKNEVVHMLKMLYAPAYSIQTFCVHGYESDDLLASFVLGLKQTSLMREAVFNKPVVVVSNDHDIHQIVLDGVHFADVTTGVMATAEQIYRHTGVHPRDIVAYKTIGGCKSDTIPGVPQCGEKTVQEIISSRGYISVKLKRARESLQSDDAIKILRRNLRLVRLPFEGNPPLPPLLLNKHIWPKAGVPDSIAERLNIEFGGGIRDIPSFSEITPPKTCGNKTTGLHTCKYKKKGL